MVGVFSDAGGYGCTTLCANGGTDTYLHIHVRTHSSPLHMHGAARGLLFQRKGRGRAGPSAAMVVVTSAAPCNFKISTQTPVGDII